MSMPVLNQWLAVTRSRSILKKSFVAAASILLASSIGTSSAFAQGSDKAADAKAAASDGSEWNGYLDGLQEQVLGKWFPPSGIEHYKGVKVEMRIRKDGRLSKADITKSSQIREVDLAAKKAVVNAAPYKPFPDGIKKEDFARFEIKFDKSDIAFKRRIVRKIDKFSKPEKDDSSKEEF